jgi:hypothetical protein
MFGLLVDILRSAYKTSYGAGGLFEGEYGCATGYNIRLSNTIIPSPFLPPYHKPDLIAPFENDDPLDMRARGAMDTLEAMGRCCKAAVTFG